jgi:hypothetical protein
MSDTWAHGQLIPGDTAEHQLNPAGVGGDSVLIKALNTNAGNVLIGKTGKTGANEAFPLMPGETVTLDLSNSISVFYKLTVATDKVAFITLGL